MTIQSSKKHSSTLAPKDSTVNYWLRDAAEQLANVGIASALLDAEIMLSHTLRKSRTWLHAYGEHIVPPRLVEIANARLDLRLDRTPVAYIIGHKEFYGRTFKVTPSVLIPRPESEMIIELLKKHLPSNAENLVDVGTGSGCLGITAKLELPKLNVTLLDVSRHALTVANENSKMLNADVRTLKSNLLDGAADKFSIVVANLPYVDANWERSPETNHEPKEALFASEGGLDLIFKLLDQLPKYISSGGLVLLEADPTQHEAIIKRALAVGFRDVETKDYVVVLQYEG